MQGIEIIHRTHAAKNMKYGIIKYQTARLRIVPYLTGIIISISLNC